MSPDLLPGRAVGRLSDGVRLHLVRREGVPVSGGFEDADYCEVCGDGIEEGEEVYISGEYSICEDCHEAGDE